MSDYDYSTRLRRVGECMNSLEDTIVFFDNPNNVSRGPGPFYRGKIAGNNVQISRMKRQYTLFAHTESKLNESLKKILKMIIEE